ncbi:thaumatin-like protein [Impatiens glandulifera]|uniref:thaumatin-like protein n=1 Tax=Impatiens glandulifera TaxID=253017 RepID=UPI001FB1272E|nr:thaumatin-like protein [Impatiens glandulifera]
MKINNWSWLIYLISHLVILSTNIGTIKASKIYLTNKCPFPIWPATAPNSGQPVIANGGFYLPIGRTKSIQAPGTWSGRIWARTDCNFNDTTIIPACQTGDCEGQLQCKGKIGIPPATLIELSLQADKNKPSFYDVSVVDGYNLPVSVSTKPMKPSCLIGGCVKDMKSVCPEELQVVNEKIKEVVACRSACLAFGDDEFCCTNEYGSPDKCKPSVYSKMFKDACPSYFSYAYDSPPPLVNCPSDEYVVTFCPSKWGSHEPHHGENDTYIDMVE